ncbi:MAG: DUF349 domain-containing protein, partial [Actinobacteria bacterium]|nr:DUF349 domain-containing protein [Actinomycetota bacterium]
GGAAAETGAVADAVEPATDDSVTAEPVVPDETVAAEPVVPDETVGAESVADAEPSADEPAAEEPAAAEPMAAEPIAAEEAHPSPVPAPAPRPAPHPGPRPSPASVHPGPRPTVRPGRAAPAAAPAVAPAPPVDPAEAARAAQFGRVDAEGTVYVVEGDVERIVGQVPGAAAPDALALYVRRFLDLSAKVALFEARLQATDLAIKEIDQTLAKLTDELAEPPAVGDLVGLRARLDGLREVAAARRAVAEAERAAAREVALAERTSIVEQAEKIAQTDPSRIQWRPAGEQLRVLLDAWKEAQRGGPRIDRASEESLWKRFSHARTTFDRERRHYFAELEARNSEARAVKEALVARAQALSTSTEWGATAGAYRDLMAEWKAAGRAARAVDDSLWAQFRAAQDAFFAARDAQAAATDAEFGANLQVKLELLTEAEALVPVQNLGAAKSALRSIQTRWEAAGKVPRADVQRVEGRMRAVETAIREAEDAQWRRTNPETRARAEGLAAQLEATIAGLEADLAKAEAAGNTRKAAEVRAALDARRAWLAQAEQAARESRG